MTGIEGILQRLRGERDEMNTAYNELVPEVGMLVFTLKDKEKSLSDLSIAVDALNLAIDAIQSRLKADTVPENHEEKLSRDEAWIMRANPFKANTIKWHCFEAMRGVITPMHYTDVHKMVWRSRHCSPSTVYNVLYEHESYFKRGDPGFFMQAEG